MIRLDPIATSAVRFAAMNLLAMREHSAAELKNKLIKKFGNPEVVEQVVNRLSEQNLQCDKRFTEAFVAMRQRQGKGPMLINAELRQRGLPVSIIDDLMDANDPLWGDLARKARVKRFGSQCDITTIEKSRQARFLQARGFSMRHIQQSFIPAPEDGR